MLLFLTIYTRSPQELKSICLLSSFKKSSRIEYLLIITTLENENRIKVNF